MVGVWRGSGALRFQQNPTWAESSLLSWRGKFFNPSYSQQWVTSSSRISILLFHQCIYLFESTPLMSRQGCNRGLKNPNPVSCFLDGCVACVFGLRASSPTRWIINLFPSLRTETESHTVWSSLRCPCESCQMTFESWLSIATWPVMTARWVRIIRLRRGYNEQLY